MTNKATEAVEPVQTVQDVRGEDTNQFLLLYGRPLDRPWDWYAIADSWDVDTAAKLIALGFPLDIKAKLEEAKEWPPDASGWRTLRSILDAYERVTSLAARAISIGVLRDPDTPANWIAWARAKGYKIEHLDVAIASPDAKQLPKGGSRRDLLRPLIEEAQGNGAEFDAPAIYTALMEWAKSKRAPLLGITEGGIKWETSTGEIRELTIKDGRVPRRGVGSSGHRWHLV